VTLIDTALAYTRTGIESYAANDGVTLDPFGIILILTSSREGRDTVV
jgi:hypothetical protein